MNEATPLKILLSAYACEPGRGSEPGVGWHWMLALAHATPVVCLDCAGPAVVVGPDLQELVVPTHGLTPEEVARRMAGKLRMLCTDEAACRDLARRSLERARRMTWQCRVEETYAEIEKAVQKKREKEEEKQK